MIARKEDDRAAGIFWVVAMLIALFIAAFGIAKARMTTSALTVGMMWVLFCAPVALVGAGAFVAALGAAGRDWAVARTAVRMAGWAVAGTLIGLAAMLIPFIGMLA